jgi:hypothetical protein
LNDVHIPEEASGVGDTGGGAEGGPDDVIGGREVGLEGRSDNDFQRLGCLIMHFTYFLYLLSVFKVVIFDYTLTGIIGQRKFLMLTG